jgi:phosphoglycerate dehydrogenase-like enzyme
VCGLTQVVSLHCNLDENTFHLLNEDRLNMMKKDAVLVNCARGPVIDEVALTNFLQANENFRWVALSPAALGSFTPCFCRG